MQIGVLYDDVMCWLPQSWQCSAV